MILDQARQKSLVRMRNPERLRRVARILETGNQYDRWYAECFVKKAEKLEQEEMEERA